MEDLAGWIGRAKEVEDELTAPAMRRLAALLDRGEGAVPPAHGAPVPPHWIAVLFDDAAPQSRIGPDGVAMRGEFLPPVPLPRRMLAGRRLAFHAPPRIGDALTRRSEIAAIAPQEGRSGRLVFVTVRHTISGPAGMVAVEEQDIVFREAVSDGEAVTAAAPAMRAATAEDRPDAAWEEPFATDPVMLFRYSALGYNGHRIHYDIDYARSVEGYPGLVVNGGLSTLMLIEAGLRNAGAPALRRYAARTLRPLICGRAARLFGTPMDAARRALLWAEDETGATALRLEVEFAA
jgi:3-methylfumaryl-CoA hydratase